MLGRAGCRLFVRYTRKVKTQVKDNCANPEWNEEFQFLVHEPDSQQLTGELSAAVRHPWSWGYGSVTGWPALGI